jgi:hypothetical protein
VGVTFDEADDRSIVVSAISLNSPAANSGVIRVGDVLHGACFFPDEEKESKIEFMNLMYPKRVSQRASG